MSSVTVGIKMNSFSYTLAVPDVPNNLYDDAVDEWVTNQDEQTIRDMVHQGRITISEFEKITGENY